MTNIVNHRKQDMCAWFLSADHFYLAARISWKKHALYKDVALYLSSQCLERYLKTLLIQSRTNFSWGHDLKALLKTYTKSTGKEILNQEEISFVHRLNKLGEDNRYPDKQTNYNWSDIDMWRLDDVVKKIRDLINSNECHDSIAEYAKINPEEFRAVFQRTTTFEIGATFTLGTKKAEIEIPNPLDDLNKYLQDKRPKL